VGKNKKAMGVQQVLLSPTNETKTVLEYLCEQSGKLYNSGVYFARQTFFKTGKLLTGKFDLIYEPSVSKTDYPSPICISLSRLDIEDIFDLGNELQTLREHLNIDKIALIFCHINPHPELINFCQQLQNDWLKIAFITDTQIASPLSSFLPQQDNLLGVVQSWLEEMG
jgi:hypothetical protein